MKLQITKKIVQIFVGIILIAIGSRLTQIASLGLGSVDIATFGIQKTMFKLYSIKISFGNIFTILMIIIFSVFLFLSKKNIKFKQIPIYMLGFLTSAIIGQTISILISLTDNLKTENLSYFFRLTFLIIGCYFITLGVCSMIKAKHGAMPIDLLVSFLADWLKEKTIFQKKINNYNFFIARYGFEIILVIIGTILGGPFGIGTILISLIIAMMLQINLLLLDKINNYISHI